MKQLSLRKSKKILISTYRLLRKKRKRLLPAQVQEIRGDLEDLQSEILQKNRERANFLAHKCEDYKKGILKRSNFEVIRRGILEIVIALAVALLIRQVWFEVYHIPTGSMRPTFREGDGLIVSKTSFGINHPFTPGHFYFEPDLTKRSGTIVFSTDNMDVAHSDTLYFFVIPGKKQFVKRLLGKPGDTIYFYGGQVYGIDASGNSITEELQPERLAKINHVPFITFDGKVTVSEPFHTSSGSAYRMAVLYQMNEPVARLTALSSTRFEGEIIPSQIIHNRSAPQVSNYYQLWGIGNYAMAMIAPKEEIKEIGEKLEVSLDSRYYLVLNHSPSFERLELSRDQYGRLRPQFSLSTSLLPLEENYLQTIFSNLYTSRFRVTNGFATRSDSAKIAYSGAPFMVRLEGVPDGTYEFFDGIAYKVYSGGLFFKGLNKRVAADHPLQQYSAEKTAALFNFGIRFNKRVVTGLQFDTSRFAYFRDGDLYLLNAPIFRKGDRELDSFIEREKARSEALARPEAYIPFVDRGPPVTADGEIDVPFIKRNGLLIPRESYLGLGDNYANSGDSREFGFVPQVNLKGAPSFIFWPFGSRMGHPNQPPYPWINLPKIIVWFIAFIGFGLWIWCHYRRNRLPLRFD